MSAPKHAPAYSPMRSKENAAQTTVFLYGPRDELLAELPAHDDNAAGLNELEARAAHFCRAVNAHDQLTADLAAMVTALRDHIATLEGAGFGGEGSINGAHAVDAVNDHFEILRDLLAKVAP